MKKNQVLIIAALALSICFGAIYMQFFSTLQEIVKIYVCQVGIYKEQDNANAMINKLKEIEIQGYSYQKEDAIIVVSDIFLEQEKAKEAGTKLSEKQFSCVIKEYSVDKEYSKDIEKKSYEKVLKELSK